LYFKIQKIPVFEEPPGPSPATLPLKKIAAYVVDMYCTVRLSKCG
jgi:hypothetical protein